MRTSPVLLAVVAAIATVYGCTLPLEGLLPEGTASAGGAPSTGSGTTASSTGGTASSTSTGMLVCATPDQCPSDVPCLSYACTMGRCVAANVTDGTPISDDAGNCKKTVCVGGAPETQSDPTDVDDGDPCTLDACDGPEPRHDPGNDGDDCGPPGQHCFKGECLECGTPDQCPQSANPCEAATCSSGICGLTEAQDGTTCADGTECKDAGVCAKGKCAQQNKSNSTSCAFGAAKCNDGCCIVASCGTQCCLPLQHCNSQDKCVLF